MKSIPILSRHITPICDSYLDAISRLNQESIQAGELVYVEYKTALPNYNIGSKKTDIIIALGTGIQNERYKILNFNSSSIIWGISDKLPGIEKLLDGQQYFYKAPDSKWYIVYSLDGIKRSMSEISSKPQTFINLENGDILVSYKDRKIRKLSNVYSREETESKLGSMSFSQKDWDETDDTKTSYIKHKPSLSEMGDLSYTVTRVQESRRVKYNLNWTPYGSSSSSVSGSIVVDENKVLVGGELKEILAEDKEEGGIFSDPVEYEDWNIGDLYLDFTIRGTTDSHIYVLMKALTDKYTGGDGIEIENNTISVKLNSSSGLSVDEIGVTWNLATVNNSGAMSSSDFIRLRDLDITPYAKTGDLENGKIVPKTSLYTEDFLAPDDHGTEDLHESFNFRSTGGNVSIGSGQARLLQVVGSGNTEETFFQATQFLSTGNNAFNYQDTTQQREGYKLDGTGDIIEDSDYTLIWVRCLKGETNELNEELKNNGYIIFGGTLGNIGFSDNLEFNSVSILTTQTTAYGSHSYIPPSPGWLLVSILTEDLENLCIRLAWTGTKDDVYEEYKEGRIELKRPENNTWGAPYLDIDGIKVYDEWISRDGFLWYIQKWEMIELENIVWEYDEGNSIYTSTTLQNLIKPATSFLLGDKEDITVLGDGTLTASQNYNTGNLYYELNNPIEYETGVSCLYYAGDYGTERFIEGTPTESSHLYLPNLYDQLRTFRNGLSEKVGKNDIDEEISGVSENPVSGNAIKNYLGKVIETIGNVKDLSRHDIYGMPLTTMNTANCYVVSEPGTYKLPLVYGNAIKNDIPNTPAYTNGGGTYQTDFVNYLGVQIVSPFIETDLNIKAYRGLICWQEQDGMITDLAITPGKECRYLTFTVNDIPDLNSNALLAVADNTDTIMWSWHIWLVSNPDSLHTVRIKNEITDVGDGGTEFDIMPVNLGFVYESEGSDYGYSPYYQWGRKDPLQRAPSNLTVYGERLFSVLGSSGDQSSDKTIGNSIKWPERFFTEYDTPNYNWFAPVSGSLETPYNLWDSSRNVNGAGNENSVKSIYDPCPYGFKVPVGTMFKGFTKTGSTATSIENMNVVGNFSSGWKFMRYFGDSLGTFFPASGYRGRSSGSLAGVGSSGYCWSSSSYSQTSGCYLGFSSGSVDPVNTSGRASGFSVRPLKE